MEGRPGLDAGAGPVCYDQRMTAHLSTAGSMRAPLEVHLHGIVPYAEALDWQRRLHAARLAGEIPDTLLLMQHPPVYTLGRRSDPRHILMGDGFLRAQGATVERNERGGEVTFHGPGQLMAYPIIALREQERSLRALVDRMETALIDTLARYDLQGRPDPSDRGVWVGSRKIASIGMAVRRWVVMHGAGLNVSTDLRFFTYINPCGHSDLEMTTMAEERGAAPEIDAVARMFAQRFAAVFERDLIGSLVPIPTPIDSPGDQCDLAGAAVDSTGR